MTIKRTYTRGRCTSPKTARERTVSVLHPIGEATGEWRPGVTVASRAVLLGLRHLKVQSLSPEAFVFGGSIAAKGLVERRWRRALALAGVRYRCPETLRHTFASTMLSRGASLPYVQRCGGWRSAGVLLRTYTAWLPEAGFDEAVAVSVEAVAAPQRHPGAGLRIAIR